MRLQLLQANEERDNSRLFLKILFQNLNFSENLVFRVELESSKLELKVALHHMESLKADVKAAFTELETERGRVRVAEVCITL